MKAPFPYFGGKSRVADAVWERLGAVKNYVEPFCGSCAVLLARPTPAHIETVNDVDGLLANFWRAMVQRPEELIAWAEWPVNEADLVARQNWLVRQRDSLTDQLMLDPEWCDPRAAGWFVWGLSAWIGRGFGEREVSAKLPEINGWGFGNGIHSRSSGSAREILSTLATRLAHVRVACGSWDRVMSRSALQYDNVPSVGVFLDPPYDEGASVYASNERVSSDVRKWCLDHGHIPSLRIALCGYEGEHEELTTRGWSVLAWKAKGGYGSKKHGQARENSSRERIWFSPHCLSGSAQGCLI